MRPRGQPQPALELEKGNERVKCEVRDGKIQVRSLEFFLADTCNLRCAHCTAASPFLTQPNFPDLHEFEESLSRLSRVMRARQIKILGGEPLLNRDIMRFIASAKSSGMFDAVRVATNGLLLSRMGEEFWQAADIVEVSYYRDAPDPLKEKDFDHFRRMGARFNVRVEIKPKGKFYLSMSSAKIPDFPTVQRIYDECTEAHVWPCHMLYRRRLYRCSRVHVIDRSLSGSGVEHGDFTHEDGLLIDDAPDLLGRVKAYLESPVPLGACHFCLGSSGRRVPHRQLSYEEVIAGRTRASRAGFEPSMLETRGVTAARFAGKWLRRARKFLLTR